jgi:voltage-gated potassium channel
MGFARQATAAILLVSLTLWLQAAGMAVVIHWARERITEGIRHLDPWRSSVLMIQFTAVMIVLHILQILLWASFYRWQCLPSWEACFYFSATSYSTVGYGDIVLPRVWRALGPVESVMGVLMCGMSVSALFSIAHRLVENESQPIVAAIRRQPLDAVKLKEIG